MHDARERLIMAACAHIRAHVSAQWDNGLSGLFVRLLLLSPLSSLLSPGSHSALSAGQPLTKRNFPPLKESSHFPPLHRHARTPTWGDQKVRFVFGSNRRIAILAGDWAANGKKFATIRPQRVCLFNFATTSAASVQPAPVDGDSKRRVNVQKRWASGGELIRVTLRDIQERAFLYLIIGQKRAKCRASNSDAFRCIPMRQIHLVEM